MYGTQNRHDHGNFHVTGWRYEMTGYHFLSLFMLVIGTAGLFTCPVTADTNGTLLIAVYASGGSFESNSGLITGDFLQITEGAAKHPADNITVVAAYGGSDKPGWDGMTIADRDDLTEDLDDTILGNDNAFQIHLPHANMGDPKNLRFFLAYLKEHYSFHRVFLVFIGHGQAYTGMLFDQNHGDDGLTIEELTESLDAGPDLELIGFDSCLMGCLEMISALSPYAPYSIASDESEPGDGWPYEVWMDLLFQNPEATTEECAAILLNEYMKTPGRGKTIALVNLKEAGYLTRNLDTFSKDLYALLGSEEGCSLLTESLSGTQHFGLTGNGTLDRATMDLYHFADTIRQNIPYLAESATGVIDGMNRTVILARHDDEVPEAHGVAVLSPLPINPVFYEYYRESAFITPSWDRFITRYLDTCSPGTPP